MLIGPSARESGECRDCRESQDLQDRVARYSGSLMRDPNLRILHIEIIYWHLPRGKIRLNLVTRHGRPPRTRAAEFPKVHRQF